ncbi:MAG: hypothetical protein QM809_18285 [Gordonia sp. (in: high G+C Gram-positive bacteria)]|uniref:hypothetical protein n=1 Tax=Gordonia sp. (in: high G+C Gram-positive bacteria) TaxID=84139 RepID=UPI0039E40729
MTDHDHDDIDDEFERTQRIGDALHALAEAERIVEAVDEPDPQQLARLDRLYDEAAVAAGLAEITPAADLRIGDDLTNPCRGVCIARVTAITVADDRVTVLTQAMDNGGHGLGEHEFTFDHDTEVVIGARQYRPRRRR